MGWTSSTTRSRMWGTKQPDAGHNTLWHGSAVLRAMHRHQEFIPAYAHKPAATA